MEVVEQADKENQSSGGSPASGTLTLYTDVKGVDVSSAGDKFKHLMEKCPKPV